MVNRQSDRFHYSIYGHKNQPVILFLHGFMGSGDDYAEICRELAGQFCCVTLDLPGHGKTPGQPDRKYYTMAETALDLIHLLDRLKIDQCFLVGYSMGGRLALYLTLHFPDRFYKVILESASPGLKTAPERSQRCQADEKIAQKLVNLSLQSVLVQWYQQKIFTSLQQHPDFKQLIQRRMEQNPRELAKSLRYMGTGKQPSLWEHLPHNPVSLLLLVGEYDDKFRLINTEMVHRCPIAQLQIIPHTGHNIHFESRTSYLRELIQFFGQSSDRPSC